MLSTVAAVEAAAFRTKGEKQMIEHMQQVHELPVRVAVWGDALFSENLTQSSHLSLHKLRPEDMAYSWSL